MLALPRKWTAFSRAMRWSILDPNQARVAEEMGNDPLANKRRGMKEIWRRIEKDSTEQEALYSARDEVEQCIVVQV